MPTTMEAGKEEILSFQTTVERIREQIGREIVGQKDVIDHRCPRACNF